MGDRGVVRTGQLPRDGFFRGDTLQASNFDALTAGFTAGDVLIISELHGNQIHHERQRVGLKALAQKANCTLSVGLEFLESPKQNLVDAYIAGQLNEADFLKQVGWGGNPFDDYREQLLLVRQTGGRGLALNAPRSLTGRISKVGVAGLTPEESALLPPKFTLGSAGYRERFDAIMGGHVPAAALQRYFEAQSTWDENMAYTATEHLRLNPTHCVAIVVGDFHAAWGGGLPDRLRARGAKRVLVISQVETRDLTEAELTAELGPHTRYGSRADAIWLSQSPP